MRKPVPAILIATLIASSCTYNNDRLTFVVRAGALARKDNSLAKDKRPDDDIEIKLPGKLHAPVTVANMTRDQADWTTPEHAAATNIAAYLSANLAWIMDGIAPAERDAARAQLVDPDARARTQSYYRNLGKIQVTGFTEIRGYKVIFMQSSENDGDAGLFTLVFTFTPGGWKQTKALTNDDTLDLVTAALRTPNGIR